MQCDRERYVLQNCEVQTYSFGEGEPLLLIPGWPMSSKVYGFLEPHLATRYRVTCVDLPGWGGKSKFTQTQSQLSVRHYVRILEDLISLIYPGGQQLSVGGLSVGGTLALLLSKRAQKRIRKVYAISAPFNGLDVRVNHRTEVFLIAIAARYPVVGHVLLLYLLSKKVVAFARTSATKQQANSPVSRKDLLVDFLSINPRSVMSFASDFFKHDYTEYLRGVMTEVVVFNGTRDHIVSHEYGRYLAEEILPNATYVELGDARHAPIMTHAAEIAEHIR